jgi:uncharacterized coiled-coil protein SlyX
MDALVPTYRTDIPQSTALANPEAAVYATDAPAIQAGSPRSINDLILQNRETERRKMIKAGVFPLPDAFRATSAEIAHADLRSHKLRTDLIAEDHVVPAWAELFFERMEGRINERIDAVEGRINERIDAVEGRINGRLVTIERHLVAVDRHLVALNGRMVAVEDAVRVTNGRVDGLIGTVNGMHAHVQGLNGAVGAVQRSVDAGLAHVRILTGTVDAVRADQLALTHRQTVLDLAIHNVVNQDN